MLYLIGLGLNDEKDVTVNGLEAIKKCRSVYLENYTSLLSCSIQNLENFYKKKIILADRNLVEKHAEETILKDAKKHDTAFLVIGDIFGATTHTDLVLRAQKQKIQVKFIHNASILNAIGTTGLELYKFGKTTSMVFFDENWKPATPYEITAMNLKNKLHTLILLDIKTAEPTKTDLLKNKDKPQPAKFMTINTCLKQLLELESIKKQDIISKQTKVVACARIGRPDQLIKYRTIEHIQKIDLGKPPHCLIIPGELHFIEEEFLNQHI